MENNQTTQHKPSQQQTSHPETTSKISQPSKFWSIYYWISLVLLSAISLGVAVYGYNKLFNISDLPQTRGNKTRTVQPSQTTFNSNSLPVWMIIAIALTCTSGCFVIFRFFQFSNKVKKVTSSKQEVRKKQIPPLPPLHPSPKTQPLAGVTPQEENNNIDLKNSNSESLADLLDIRQQTSISSTNSEKE